MQWGSMGKEDKVIKKKKLIIEALKSLLSQRTYSNITVQDVADESGFSKGGVLHYFETKEDLYLELIKDLFSEIRSDHEHVLRGDLQSGERASLSALYGIEKFFLEKKTVRVILNLFLYSMEDEKIKEYIKNFSTDHLNLYHEIIQEARGDKFVKRKTDLDSHTIARIAQIIILASGILESVDDINVDTNSLIKFVISLLKG